MRIAFPSSPGALCSSQTLGGEGGGRFGRNFRTKPKPGPPRTIPLLQRSIKRQDPSGHRPHLAVNKPPAAVARRGWAVGIWRVVTYEQSLARNGCPATGRGWRAVATAREACPTTTGFLRIVRDPAEAKPQGLRATNGDVERSWPTNKKPEAPRRIWCDPPEEGPACTPPPKASVGSSKLNSAKSSSATDPSKPRRNSFSMSNGTAI